VRDAITRSWKSVRSSRSSLYDESTSCVARRPSILTLYETYYWDSSAQYFSPWVNPASQPSEVQESGFELEETLEDLEVDTREVVTAPADFRVLESQIAAVECAQMIVREGTIAFNALLRHTDIYVTTAEIPKQVFESVLTIAAA
jgi:hypothetical protein